MMMNVYFLFLFQYCMATQQDGVALYPNYPVVDLATFGGWSRRLVAAFRLLDAGRRFQPPGTGPPTCPTT